MKITKAVIPAAGLGTRMLPATKTVPKEMLPIVDKPAIQYIVEEAVAAGIEDILVVTNRAKTSMDDYFDYHPELENRLFRSGHQEEAEALRAIADKANIFYVRQKDTKGLGHAIWRAKQFVGQSPFAVLLGDDIMRSQVPVTKQLIDAAIDCGGAAVGVQRVPSADIHRYCSLQVRHRANNVYDVQQLIEKPTIDQVFSNFAILGRYVLTPAIFDILETLPAGFGGEVQLTDGINILCQRETVVAVDFEGRRYDTGNLCGYLETLIDFALVHPEAGPWLQKHLQTLVKQPDSTIR